MGVFVLPPIEWLCGIKNTTTPKKSPGVREKNLGDFLNQRRRTEKLIQLQKKSSGRLQVRTGAVASVLCIVGVFGVNGTSEKNEVATGNIPSSA